MTIMTIGVRRYIRPYLPVFNLLAVAALPLLLVFLGGVLNLSVSIGRREFRLRWKGAV
jgi:hypothetical protein